MGVINESLNEKYNKSLNAARLAKWKNVIDGVKKADPKFSDISAVNLAIVCENADEEIKKYQKRVSLSEAVQPADVGPYIRHAFELITGVQATLVAEEVVSVQALKQKIGQIFFLKYVYGSNKGSVKRGDVANGPYEINSNPDYSSERIDQEILATTSEATLNASLQWGPVIAGTVKLTCGTATAEDDGHGAITGDFTGTIDYATQSISLAGLPTGESVEAAYEYNLGYAPSEAAEFDLVVDEKVVIARPRKLRTRYSFDAAYDLEKQFGFDIDDEMLEQTVNEIKHEIDQEILGDLFRQAALTSTWDMTRPQAVSEEEHWRTFNHAIIKASNDIFKASKRGKGNILICGLNAQNVVETLPAFVPAAGEADEAGAHVIGTLKGGIKVIANPWYGDDDYLLAYKGNKFIDAGYVYAPYIPVFATNVIMLDDFMGRRGYGTSYAKVMLNPKFYVRGKITHNPAVIPVTVVE